LVALRARAMAEGLWNMGLPMLEADDPGVRLSNLEYAFVAEVLGRLRWASYVFNCQPPDTPTAEILQQFGTPVQKEQWLKPLLAGQIRSTFSMTEPAVASSDATNVATRITSDGDDYVISGRKWFSTNAGHPLCKFAVVVGVTDEHAARGRGHTMVIVPTDTPGFTIERTLSVFGHKDVTTPHDQVLYDSVRVPKSNRLGNEGEGFLIGQARLGPARVHHAMRAIGHCEVMLKLMVERASYRKAFGKSLHEYSNIQEWIAESRLELEQSRLLVQKTAWMLDTVGNKVARREISMIKIAVARTYNNIANRAIQVFGGMGVTDDGPFAAALATARAFRIYDGPDEVHQRTLYRLEEQASAVGEPWSPHYLRGPGNLYPS
ncbi:MAG: acyl-CoA dehydrogenase family protein, partial [Burkholderiaceae bacterium]